MDLMANWRHVTSALMHLLIIICASLVGWQLVVILGKVFAARRITNPLTAGKAKLTSVDPVWANPTCTGHFVRRSMEECAGLRILKTWTLKRKVICRVLSTTWWIMIPLGSKRPAMMLVTIRFHFRISNSSQERQSSWDSRNSDQVLNSTWMAARE